MPSRVSPTEQIRASIDALFADPDLDLGATMEEVARLSVRLVFQTALEAEVTEFLGRHRYARGDRAREGSRNGYSDVTVKITAGPVALRRPKVRGALEAFSSRLLGKGVTRTNALEALVISGWVRGLSTRDIEAALAETLGPDAGVSKSTVSQICTAIRSQFDAFRRHADEFASKWGARYPGAVACVVDDFDHLVAHLHFPRAHWRRIRHTNLVERTFGETRRRVKVMGRLPVAGVGGAGPRQRRVARCDRHPRRRPAADPAACPARAGHLTRRARRRRPTRGGASRRRACRHARTGPGGRRRRRGHRAARPQRRRRRVRPRRRLTGVQPWLTAARVVGHRVGVSDTTADRLAELADVTGRLGELHVRQDALVVAARAAGATWAQVAEALGVSVQAAHKRYRDVKLDRAGRAWKDRPLPL